MFFWGILADGQNVVTVNELYRQPTTPVPETQRAPRTEEQSALDTLNALTVDDLLNSRKFRWEVSGGAAWTYNNNIYSSITPVADQILTPTCGLAATYGEAGAPLNFAGHYGLSYNQYQKYTQMSGMSQSLGMNATWLPGPKTTVTGALSYGDGRGSTLGSSAQQNSSTLGSSLGVRYQVSDKISSGCDFTSSMQTLGVNQSYTNNNINLVSDYQFTAKMKLGVGLGGGMRTLNSGQGETDQSVQFRWNYEMSGKMSFSGNVGWETRFLSGGGSNGQPRFQCAWQYRPLERTSLGISAYRQTDSSASSATLTTGQSLGCTATLSQLLFQRVSLNISGGLEKFQQDTMNLSTSGNSGTTTVLSASLGYQMLRWVDGSVFCRSTTRQGSSNYDQTTCGIQLSARY